MNMFFWYFLCSDPIFVKYDEMRKNSKCLSQLLKFGIVEKLWGIKGPFTYLGNFRVN